MDNGQVLWTLTLGGRPESGTSGRAVRLRYLEIPRSAPEA